VARDLLADAIVDLEDHFPGVLLATIHDEIVAMTSTEAASYLLSGMKTLMSMPPAWAKGMPLSCAGAVVKRYGKI
jgi:hypothetical protein